LAKFSVEEFEAVGLDAEDRFLIQFMAEQECAITPKHIGRSVDDCHNG
jgi:hypothetical protein